MVKIKEGKRLVNAGEFAKELAISRQHLYCVLHGIRHSPRVEAALLQRGITPKNHTTNKETP